MARKRGRPTKDDRHLLHAVARLLVQGKAPTRHAAMMRVVAQRHRDATERQIRSIIRRIERKWKTAGDDCMAAAEEEIARERELLQGGGLRMADLLAGYNTPGLGATVDRFAEIHRQIERTLEPMKAIEQFQRHHERLFQMNDALAARNFGIPKQLEEFFERQRQLEDMVNRMTDPLGRNR